ncbi:MAG: hypothetical protein NDI60_09745 [Elusimicrobiales bacterium]|nr:hypothetical protein [Elusimicrobiales bacterium]
MTLDYGTFAKASTLIHLAQGAALVLLGAAEAYALDNSGRKVLLAGAAALLAAAVATPLLVLAVTANWSAEQLRLALEVRRGFLLFFAFACLFGAAGLSRLTQVALDRRGGGWQTLFFGFLALIGLLYFLLPSRVNEDAPAQVLVLHAAMGVTLLLAVAAKAAHASLGRRQLHIAWAVLLMITGLQLLTYREAPTTFGLRLVTLESAPETAPAAAKPALKNAGTADKERPAR